MYRYVRQSRYHDCIRCCHAQYSSEVTLLVCAGFKHEHVRIMVRQDEERERTLHDRDPRERVAPRILHTKDSKGDAEFAIETLIALADEEARGEHRRERVLRCCLPDRATHHQDTRSIPAHHGPRNESKHAHDNYFEKVFHVEKPRSGGTA